MRILLGVCAGIAAFKAADLVSQLKKQGHCIKVVMTPNSVNFITPLTLQTLSQNPVCLEMFGSTQGYSNPEIDHIALADWAELALIAPATYNIIGKVASGIADDLLSTVISATKALVIFAPAMNCKMYENPIFRRNRKILEDLGYTFIEPETGDLACGYTGTGRLAQVSTILNNVGQFTPKNSKLKGKKVLITAGPTVEPIDPVRYISNKSSGLMGYSLASAAARAGAIVTLISGPVSLSPDPGIEVIKVQRARQMREAVLSRAGEQDMIIGCAAVADFRAAEFSGKKIKRKSESLTLNLTANPDIIAEAGKLEGKPYLTGFAAESNDPVANAKEKMRRKNLDCIILNSTEYAGEQNNKVVVFFKDGREKEFPLMDKKSLAIKLINILADQLSNNVGKTGIK